MQRINKHQQPAVFASAVSVSGEETLSIILARGLKPLLALWCRSYCSCRVPLTLMGRTDYRCGEGSFELPSVEPVGQMGCF